ncbi:alpha/beta hydrolase [Pseudonocardia kunmingensis]|uniref:Acetyl esterase/lipase n=1 Tax=Pseudonocardia kunmingensis TaxID=630975 RepID=A0A543CY31_9PSEU|nr:alpha/beta hydrolase [Pseudonocardia kunmingensis]TQM01768.1 acetyl esterase/lipase [Pseudonocardia kunmingensis]
MIIHDVAVVRRPGRDLMLDLVTPATPGPHPVVAWLPGGAFLRGDRKRLPARIDDLLARGVAVAALEYRFSSEARYPAQILDVRAGLRHLYHHAERHGLDRDRIALWGASAGGHLAALAGLLARVPVLDGEPDGPRVDIAAVAAAYPLTDLTSTAPVADAEIPDLAGTPGPVERLLGGCPTDLPELARAASPLHQVHRGAPPFQICHGDADRLVDPTHSVRLHHRLLAAGAASELIVLPGFGHSFLNARADGDVDATGGLLEPGRLAAEQPVPAQRDTGRGPRPTRFGFDSIAAFLSDHLGSSLKSLD